MIREAIEYLAHLGAKAKGPSLVPEMTNECVVMVEVDGQLHGMQRPTKPRAHKVHAVADLINLANDLGRDGVSAIGEKVRPAVWFNPDRVVLIVDDGGNRLDTATLTFEFSDTFAVIAKLASRPAYSHKDFCRLLRNELSSAIPASQLLDKIARLDFAVGSQAQAESKRYDSSLSRSVTQAVASSAGAIPEVVTLTAKVYKTAGEHDLAEIKCGIDIDPVQATISLFPLPDELDRAKQAAAASVGARLDGGLDEGIPAYFGQP